MTKRDPSALVQLKVRMREAMRDEIEKAAKEAGHSMNAEIIRRLEASQREKDWNRAFDALDQRNATLEAEISQQRQQLDVILNGLREALDHRIAEDES